LPIVPEYCRATHADAVPSLPLAGVVDHPGLRLDHPDRQPHQRFPHRHHIPRRGGDELLQPLMIHPEPLRHGLHRLTPAVQHQTPQIQPARGPLISPPKRGEHLGGKGIQLLADRSKPTNIHTSIIPETVAAQRRHADLTKYY